MLYNSKLTLKDFFNDEFGYPHMIIYQLLVHKKKEKNK